VHLGEGEGNNQAFARGTQLRAKEVRSTSIGGGPRAAQQ